MRIDDYEYVLTKEIYAFHTVEDWICNHAEDHKEINEEMRVLQNLAYQASYDKWLGKTCRSCSHIVSDITAEEIDRLIPLVENDMLDSNDCKKIVECLRDLKKGISKHERRCK